MPSYHTTPSGILVPGANPAAAAPIPCGYCPRKIHLAIEVDKKLYRLGGKPICVVCRAVKLGKQTNRIMGDKKRALEDEKDAERFVEHKENVRVAEIAAASQIKTGTQSHK